MDINERQKREKETPETYSAEAGPTVPAVADQPTRPKSMSEDEAESVRSQAIELVKQLEDAGGSGSSSYSTGSRASGLRPRGMPPVSWNCSRPASAHSSTKEAQARRLQTGCVTSA